MEEQNKGMENKSSKLLEELECKAITLDQQQRNCLLWTLDIKNEYNPIHFPSKPMAVVNYETIPLKERKQLKPEYYNNKPEIMEYYNTIIKIFNGNEGKIEWFQEMKVYCETEAEFNSIQEIIKRYEPICARQGAELKIKKYLYKNPFVQKVQKEFGG